MKSPGTTHPQKTTGSLKTKRKPIRKVSEKQTTINKEYSALRKAFLELNPFCMVDECPELASDIHHKSGRRFGKMLDTSTWMSVCRLHHTQIHDRPEWAKAQKYIIPIYS